MVVYSNLISFSKVWRTVLLLMVRKVPIHHPKESTLLKVLIHHPRGSTLLLKGSTPLLKGSTPLLPKPTLHPNRLVILNRYVIFYLVESQFYCFL